MRMRLWAILTRKLHKEPRGIVLAVILASISKSLNSTGSYSGFYIEVPEHNHNTGRGPAWRVEEVSLPALSPGFGMKETERYVSSPD